MDNIVFPQLSTGSVSHYPLRKQRRLRSITNVLPDGRLILFQDVGSSLLQWMLNFAGLSLQDAYLLQAHFEVCSGPLHPFIFPDPSDNLLSWSSDLSNSAWQRSSSIHVGTQVSDPLGTSTAFATTNTSQAPQEFLQTIPVPAYYFQCFSFYVRSSHETSIQIIRRGATAQDSVTVAVSAAWTRHYIAGSLADGALSTTFGFSVRPGDQVEIFGPQVEIQKFPSTYVSTTAASGLHTNAFFSDQQLNVIAQAPNAFAATVNIQAYL